MTTSKIEQDVTQTSTNDQSAEKDYPWTEDPKVAYQNFLKYAGDNVNDSVAYNNAMVASIAESMGNKTPSGQEVHAHNGVFYPLDLHIGQPFYTSKVTFRNIEKAKLYFEFESDILPRILGVTSSNKELLTTFRVAYRNIVPAIFSKTPSIAGPMGFHEYIIDGSNFKSDAAITCYAHPDYNQTPLKVVIENCGGSCLVDGLETDAIAKVFENKCATNRFILFSLPTITKDTDDDEDLDAISELKN
ncbi:MAG: hypothetical protein WC627_13475 [Legionella sp.]|jgi:hypothetical protein